MKNAKPRKITKKEIKVSLIKAIESTLLKLNNDQMLSEKIKKSIKKNVKKIASKLPKGKKKLKKSSDSAYIEYPTKTNKKFIQGLKDKPTINNLKEVLDI